MIDVCCQKESKEASLIPSQLHWDDLRDIVLEAVAIATSLGGR